MPIIPTENRGYTLAFIAIGGFVVLAGIAMWKNPNQYQYILELLGDKMMWLLPLIIGSKEIGKSFGNLTSGYKIKHENGAKKPQEGGSE